MRLEGPDGWRIVWATADPVAGAGWSSTQVEAIECFLPHLRQFARVRQAVVDARARGASAVDLLGSRRTGAVQLDRRGRVAAANDVALDLLRKNDGLSDLGGVQRAVVPAENAELSRLSAQAVPFAGGVGVSRSMLVSRPPTSLRLELHVSPVDLGRPEERSSRMGALVLAIDLTRGGAILVGRVGAILGLTPAESQVAVSLARGMTIRDIAAGTGRSTTTFRWHLRRIGTKLGIAPAGGAGAVRLLPRRAALASQTAASWLGGRVRVKEGCSRSRFRVGCACHHQHRVCG